MKIEVFDDAERWLEHGESVALATVVRTGGSSPRPVGSALAISGTGEMAGSVSGGCIEGAVVVEAESVLRDGSPKLLRYGITDEDAWAVGLSCGGEIEVFLEKLQPGGWLAAFLEDARSERFHRSALVIGGTTPAAQQLIGLRAIQPTASGEWTSPDVSSNAAVELAGWLRRKTLADGVHRAGNGDGARLPELEVFLHTHRPPDHLVIVGAVHIAEHLVPIAQRLGFHCTVVDAREAFATPARFGTADDLLIGWPGDIVRDLPLHPSTYCVCLTHDPKLDDPVLLEALAAKAHYIGALGSTRTHARRLERLEAEGADPELLRHIDGPIGVDLGGRKPEEIALAIAARLVEMRAGRWPARNVAVAPQSVKDGAG